MPSRCVLGGTVLIIVIALAGLVIGMPWNRTPSPQVHTSLLPKPLLAPATFASRCQTTGTRCAGALLRTINEHRAQRGLPPYILDWGLTHGNPPSCYGATSHAQMLAATNSLWHTNPTYPAQSFPKDVCGPWTTAGQNAGEGYSGQDKLSSILASDTAMMNEGPSGGHYQSLMSESFRRVGIGIAHGSDRWYLVESFTD